MSREWDGLSLQSEFSVLGGDTSTSFKTKILVWLNDIISEIYTKHDWPFALVKGKKVLTASTEVQDLKLATPGAPTAATAAGGSLTSGTAYLFLVTFYESVADVESLAGTASASVTPSAANLLVNLTAIPTSSDPLVTARKIYVKKGTADYIFDQTISDNTTTTATVSTDSTSTIEPPDYTYIKKLNGNPFIEASGYLEKQEIDYLRRLFQGTFGTGSPSYWANFGASKVLLYPVPSSASTLSFYYYRMPNRLYAVGTSAPDLPYFLKDVLWAGMLAKIYEYRDRDGQESKKNNYRSTLAESISTHGTLDNALTRVQDTFGERLN